MSHANIIVVEAPDDWFVPLPLAVPEAKFPLGRIVMTSNAYGRLPAVTVELALRRHAAGDWGEVCREDAASNELSLQDGSRLLSVYGAGAQKFWIITEADRSVTTILMPEDY